ncbi:MAG: hypothetical protein IKJ43_04350 [Bacilli bacterium]|nr:hypothetical protein [Bacilli bacterium]
MTEKKEIEEIIRKAQKISIYALNELCKKLNLDSKAVLSNLPNLRFGNMKQTSIGEYYPESNEIVLKNKIINIISKSLKEHQESKENVKEWYIMEIAETIIHETIHSLRTINRKGNEIDNLYLSRILLDLEFNEHEIDNEERPRTVCYILPDKTTDEIENLMTEGNENDIYDIINGYQEQINLQEGLEECLTEGLAQIALKNLLHKRPLEETYGEIINDPKTRLDTLIGVKIFQNLDEEMIKWFLTTRLNPNYENLIEEEYKDDYLKLLKVASGAYSEVVNSNVDEKLKNSTLEKLDEIIESRSHKKTI